MPIAAQEVAATEDIMLLVQAAGDALAAGQLDKARPLVLRALNLAPGHPEAMHIDALLALASGCPAEALELIDRVLTQSPRHAAAHLARGESFRALGRPDDALEAYRQSIALDGVPAPPWRLLGHALRELGRHDEALRAYREALARDPADAEAALHRGLALEHLGRSEEAREAFETSVRLQPDSAEAHDHLGLALHAAGRMPEAVEALGRAVALNPDRVLPFCHLGIALTAAGRHQEAIEALHGALALDAGCPEAHCAMGAVRRALGYLDQSLAAYREALSVRPDFSEAHFQLGCLLAELNKPVEATASLRAALAFRPGHAAGWRELGRLLLCLDHGGEAVTTFRRALELAPQDADTWFSLGTALGQERRAAESAAAFGRATAIRPDFAEAHWRRGLALVAAGDYPLGWAEAEWRFKVPGGAPPSPYAAIPAWDGRPFPGGTLLVHATDRLVSVLQYARYLPLAAARGARLVLACPATLRRLVESLPSIAQVIVPEDPAPAADWQAPLESLPHLLGGLSAAPAELPYLPVATWSGRIPMLPPARGLRVALSLGGRPFDPERSALPAELLTPILALPDITWFTLEHANALQPLLLRTPSVVAHDLTPRIRDFADLAALIGQVDLIITTDSVVAHLAGALGQPVWVLSRQGDWLWGSATGESEWYPTARGFRPTRPGDWSSAIEELRRALQVVLAPEVGVA